MKRARPGVGSELLPVALILVGLVGTLGLVIAVHRKAADAAARANAAVRAKPSIVLATAEPAPAPAPVQPPAPKPPPPPPPPAIPPEDPTRAALARIASEADAQRRAAGAADRRAAALEAARKAAVAASERARRHEVLVKAQVAELDAKARDLEAEADALAMERDALARERDAARAALVKAAARGGGYAVLPHKGANGTWQRPVVLECRDGQAVLQPGGLSFSIVDMSSALGPRSSPLVAAVAGELIKAHRATSPDGEPVIPYIYFIVRPDGIRPYYEARARLEPLGIAFGYELVEQDTEIEFPDFDDLESWDGGTTPRPGTNLGAPAAGAGAGAGALARGGGSVWPVDRPDFRTRGGRGGDGEGPEKFLWPVRPPGPGGGDIPDVAGGPEVGRGLSGVAQGGAPPRVDQLDPERLLRRGLAAAGGLSVGDDPSVGALRELLPPGGTGPGDRRGATGGSSARGNGGAAGPESDTGGLIAISPEGLPGFDSPGGASAPGGRSSAPGGPDGNGRQRFRNPRMRIERGPYVAGVPGGTGTGGQGSVPPTPPGRVRIDPAQVALADDPFGDSHDPPEAGTSQPGAGAAGSGSAGNPDRKANPAGPRTPGGTESPLGSPPTGGVGQPSGSGGQAGQVGLGLPSMTSRPSGLRAGDIRPRRSTAPPWAPSRTTTIDVPLELVVACGPDGVVIHPGGYRLSASALRKPGVLTRDLETIVHNHALIDPAVRPRPRVRFLIEPGGGETYQEARRRTVLAGLSWPVSLQVAGPPAPRVFPKERF